MSDKLFYQVVLGSWITNLLSILGGALYCLFYHVAEPWIAFVVPIIITTALTTFALTVRFSLGLQGWFLWLFVASFTGLLMSIFSQFASYWLSSPIPVSNFINWTGIAWPLIALYINAQVPKKKQPKKTKKK